MIFYTIFTLFTLFFADSNLSCTSHRHPAKRITRSATKKHAEIETQAIVLSSDDDEPSGEIQQAALKKTRPLINTSTTPPIPAPTITPAIPPAVPQTLSVSPTTEQTTTNPCTTHPQAPIPIPRSTIFQKATALAGILAAKLTTLFTSAPVTRELVSMKPQQPALVKPYHPLLPTPGSVAPSGMIRGINNPDIMCFMNATLQGMFASPTLCTYVHNFNRANIMRLPAEIARTFPTDAALLNVFLAFRDTYFLPTTHYVIPNDPTYTALADRAYELCTGAPAPAPGVRRRNQTADEFYTGLMNSMFAYDQTISKTSIATTRLNALRQYDILPSEDQFIVNVPIPGTLPAGAHATSVTQLMKDYETAERLDSGEEIQATITPQKVLVVNVKRAVRNDLMGPLPGQILEQREGKIKTPLAIEKFLTINGTRFMLTAILFHGGETMHSGHWTTLRQETEYDPTARTFTNTGTWIYCNDAHLFNTPESFPVREDVTTGCFMPIPGQADATMLFYERVPRRAQAHPVVAAAGGAGSL